MEVKDQNETGESFSQVNVESLIKCINYLPEGYRYIVLEEKYMNDSNFEVEFRCNIKTEDEAKDWLGRLSEKSFVTWRVGKTHPDTGRYNVFKIEYRCRYRGTHKIKEGSGRKSYNTSCPSWLTLTIKRYIHKSKSKILQNNICKEHPCVIRLKNVHNHDIGTCEALRLRDVSKTVKEKLRSLYREGYTPSIAHQKLHSDAMIQYGEDYNKISADRRYCPNKAFCYDLYYAEFQKSCKKSITIEDAFNADQFESDNLMLENNEYDKLNGLVIDEIPIAMDNDIEDDTVIVFNGDNTVEVVEKQKLSFDLGNCLNEIYQRFMNPPLTIEKISAIKNFIHNYTKLLQNEKDFLEAAQNFGIKNVSSNSKRKENENDSGGVNYYDKRVKADNLDTIVVNTKDMHCYSQLTAI